MAPRNKVADLEHELFLANQRIQVLELEVKILERKLELAKMNQRSYPYTYYGTSTTNSGYLGSTSG